MNLKKFAKKMSNCTKEQVGCILMHNDTILSVGFNYHRDGVCDCDTTATALHAERMAIERLKVQEVPNIAIVTKEPCMACLMALKGINKDIQIIVED